MGVLPSNADARGIYVCGRWERSPDLMEGVEEESEMAPYRNSAPGRDA